MVAAAWAAPLDRTARVADMTRLHDWHDRAQQRHEDEQRGHVETQAERDQRYWDTLDRIGDHAPAGTSTASLHAATRRQLAAA